MRCISSYGGHGRSSSAGLAGLLEQNTWHPKRGWIIEGYGQRTGTLLLDLFILQART